MVSQANLLRQGRLIYGGGWWNATLMAQRYQTLQDPEAPVAIPYYTLPQFTGYRCCARTCLAASTFNFTGEYVNFDHPTQVHRPADDALSAGVAADADGRILRHAQDRRCTRRATTSIARPPACPSQLSRQVPIVSVDSGVVFERDVNWFGRSLFQTAGAAALLRQDSRTRDQSQIPVFDSGVDRLQLRADFRREPLRRR